MATARDNFQVRFRTLIRKQLLKDTDPEEEVKDFFKPKPYVPESPFSVSNICWLIASIGVFYYLDVGVAVLYDPRVKRTWFQIGCALIGVNITIALWLIVYMSHYKKIVSSEWDKHYPAAIPIATAAFIFGAFCVTVAVWPLWSFATPFILFTLFMGIIIVITMLPNWF